MVIHNSGTRLSWKYKWDNFLCDKILNLISYLSGLNKQREVSIFKMVQKSKGGKKSRSVISGKKKKNAMKHKRKDNYKKNKKLAKFENKN